MTVFYVMIAISVIAFLVGVTFIKLSLRLRRKDAYVSAILDDEDVNLKIARAQMKTGIISCVLSGLTLLFTGFQVVIALTGNIPAPLLAMTPSREAGRFEVVIERKKYPFGAIYYRVNQGAPVEYKESFLIFPQDTVTAYISFLGWSGSYIEDSPRSPSITVCTVATLKSSGDILLRCKTIEGDTDLKSIPLYQSAPDDDIRIIDVKGVAQLTVSAEDLRRLFYSGRTNEVTATVVVKDPDDPRSIVEVALTKNGRNVDVPMQDMVLYLPHQEDDPNQAVAQRLWEADAFGSDAISLIPCSVADGKTIAIPLTSSAKIQVVSRDPGFTDGPFDEEEAVSFAGSHGILHGVGGGRFSPQANMTRGSVVTALYNMAGSPWTDSGNSIYSDVPKDSWYAQAVAWALEEEIAIGVSQDLFRPDEPVTRGQFALMLWRYSGRPAATSSGLPKYDDLGHVKGDEYTALCWMLQEGILTDTGGDLIRPGGRVVREEAAVMLMRLCRWLIGMDAG